jgi:hypothetical protein
VRTFSIVAVCVIDFIIGVRYVWLIRAGKISPSLAMWVFFTMAVIGSLMTYLAEGSHALLDNVLNSADVLLCGAVALAIALWGDPSSRFNRFDLGCLGAVAAILAAWAATRQHMSAHLAIQLVLVVAYLPVVKRLWRSDRNTESFTMWIGLMVAPAFSLLSSQGVLATVYAVRAMVSTALLLMLMIRVERRVRGDTISRRRQA